MQLKKSGQNVEVQELPLGGTSMLQWPDDTNSALPNKDTPSPALIIVFTTFGLTSFPVIYWFGYHVFATMVPTLILIHLKQLHLRKKTFKNIDIPQLDIFQISALNSKETWKEY